MAFERAREWVAQRVRGQGHPPPQAVGRWLRALLLLVLLWITWGYFGDPLHRSIFDGVTLGFHEMGHAAFSWLRIRILTVAGGTIFQIAIPIAAGGYLLHKQNDPFGAAVCVFWLGTSLFNAGVYAADARAQALPLVSPFGPVDVDSHDWTVMLLRFGMLTKDEMIGAALRRAGLAAMLLSIAGGAWVLRVMAVESREAGR